MTTTNTPPRRCAEHGNHRAGCTSCQARNRWYNRRRREKARTGRWEPMVPVETVRAHIADLRAAGMRIVDIAEDSGVPLDTINRVTFATRQQWVTPLTAALIRGVQPRPVDSALVSAVGTIRRLQALARIGWTTELIAERGGTTADAVRKLSDSTLVTRANRDRIRAAYEQLSGTRGPSRLAALRSERRGFLPPLAWDEGSIDDPNAVPHVGGPGDDIVDDVAIREVLAGRLKFKDLREQEKVALFRDHLDDWGYTPIMDLLRMSAGTVQKWRTLARYGPRQQVAA